MGAKENGKAFLDEVLAHVPAEQQASVRAALESDQVLTTIGAGVLRQSDYSRQQDALRAEKEQVSTWRGSLETWQQQEQARLEQERAALASAAPAPTITSPAIDTTKFLTADDFKAALAQKETEFVNALAFVPTLGMQHFAKFGTPLDTPALLKHPEIGTLGIQGVYEKVYAEQLAAKAKEAADREFDQKYQARLAEERKAHPALPYPSAHAFAREPSALDALEAAQSAPARTATGEAITPAMSVVDRAVQEYQELTAARR